MTIIDDILAFLEQLSQDENLKQTTFESAKAGVFVGIITAAGAILLGPPGIAVGAAVGGAIGSFTCRDFKPLHQVIRQMNQERRQRLADSVQRIMSRENLRTVADLTAAAAAGTALRKEVIDTMVNNVK